LPTVTKQQIFNIKLRMPDLNVKENQRPFHWAWSLIQQSSIMVMIGGRKEEEQLISTLIVSKEVTAKLR
jgi:hypothetical protein